MPLPDNIRRHPSRRGTSAIELALTLPVMLAVVFGVVEYGWFHGQHGLMESAVASACRQASLRNPLRGDVIVLAEGLLDTQATAAGIDCADGSASCTAAFEGSAPMQRLRCEISTPYTPVTGLLPTPERMAVVARVRMEYQD